MESLHTKDCNHSKVSSPNFESFESKDSDLDESTNETSESFDTKLCNDTEVSSRKFESFESKDTKVDGRSKPRTRKQIDAYKRNFGAGKVIERKIYELDKRLQHLQQLLLNIRSNQL